jgi:hypothetical protein
MATWVDGVIVSLIAIGASVLVGLLGYFADKGAGDSAGEPAAQKPEGKKA